MLEAQSGVLGVEVRFRADIGSMKLYRPRPHQSSAAALPAAEPMVTISATSGTPLLFISLQNLEMM